MKKVLLGLVAVAVAIGFATTVLAEEIVKTKTTETKTGEVTKGEVKTEAGTVKFKEKTETKAGQTVTTEKAKLVTGKAGHKHHLYGKITEYSDKDGSVTILRYKDETLSGPTTSMNFKVAPHHANAIKKHTGKQVIFASDTVTVDELVKDGLISKDWELMPAMQVK